jgi:hypothetical protein
LQPLLALLFSLTIYHLLREDLRQPLPVDAAGRDPAEDSARPIACIRPVDQHRLSSGCLHVAQVPCKLFMFDLYGVIRPLLSKETAVNIIDYGTR